MENNTDTVIVVESNNFKHTIIKIAVATMASVIAKKVAEVVVDRLLDRNQTVATVETAN